MRIGLLLGALGSAAVLTTGAQGGSLEPVVLGSATLDRITAGAFESNVSAGALAESDSLAGTFVDGVAIVQAEDDPRQGSLLPTVGVAGGDAAAITIGGGGSRSVAVETDVGGDGFEAFRLSVGGSTNGPIASYVSENVVVITTVTDPIFYRK
jgi:hypothetical protein